MDQYMEWYGMEVFTLHELWWKLLDLECWNSMEFQQNPVGWSLSHFGFPFHENSNGIQWNWSESRSPQEWNPLEFHLDSNVKFNPNGFPRIPLYSVEIQIFQLNSNRFQQIPMFALVTVIIHKKYMVKY